MDFAKNTSRIIIEGLNTYMSNFNTITHRAKTHFEQKDWLSIHEDSKERLALYKNTVQAVAKQVSKAMDVHDQDKGRWRMIKHEYQQESMLRMDNEIARTFFNSVCRKVIRDIGGDKDIMFLFREEDEERFESNEPIYNRYYWGNKSSSNVFKEILEDYAFDTPYDDIDRDVALINQRLEAEIFSHYYPDQNTRIEILKSVFFRNKGAYLVGRIYIRGSLVPFALPLLHGKAGIYVDTFVHNSEDLSVIFSFTRSYFLVEVNIPSEFVLFLQSLIPNKQRGELYNSIGFSKHGKTEFYRDFMNHLQHTEDQFILAPGIKGMVMSVFTLPSYNIVFKLIKDKFDPPKKMNRAQVKSKYKLVSQHDRVGRMADTHEFEYFAFDKNRFSSELLEELQTVAPSLINIEGDTLTLKHLYTERRMIPLNIYLDNCTDDEAEEAVGEYGNAIKQLAAANIFPGDMLLKNFGVTRHKRVVFYDYDEISFLTECNFRRIPEARDHYQEMSAEAWYSVGPDDVFPEEFRKFLIGHSNIRQMFYKLHGDIFDVKFWIDMQKRIRNGEVVDVFPYRRRRRFRQEV